MMPHYPSWADAVLVGSMFSTLLWTGLMVYTNVREYLRAKGREDA